MRLLIDTDSFCFFAGCGLLEEVFTLFDVAPADCRRLPALPHMLRRGALRKQFGDSVCENLLPLAQGIQPAPEAAASWQDIFTGINNVDPGEAQLFALAAEHGLLLMTGDKRALRAIMHLKQVCERLPERVVVTEALLIQLCIRLGEESVRDKVTPLVAWDKMVGMCFSLTPVAARWCSSRAKAASRQSNSASVRGSREGFFLLPLTTVI